jgi:Ca2+-binding RTX toxin-like protein
LTDLLNGRSVRGVRIEGVADDRDDNPAVVYKLDLVTAHLTADAVSAAGGDSGALSLSIGYNAYALSTFGQNPDTGILSPPVIRSYDFFKGVADAVVIPSISPGSDGNGPPPVPAVPSSLALDASADSGVQGDHLTNAAHLVIDGITSANANVTIHDGAVVVGSGTADASGVFVISTTDLAEGLHGLTATANFTGGASSASSSSLPITIDRTAPGAPTGLHLDAATDTGTLGDGVTAATVLKIDGSAEAGSTVTLSEGGVTLGTAVADGTTGAFQVTTSALAAGSHSFTATATDAAGNPGVASSPLVVTLNTLSFPADTGTHTGSELAGVTGSASPDTVNAALSFTDNDATAHHSVGVGATATLALSSGAVPAGLASALAGLASATVTEPAGGGAGAVNATFQAPDKLFDFLGQGQSLTVSYSLSLSSDHGGTVSEPVTFTITGANDAPTAAPDTATVAEEATVTINVLGNDTDPDQGDHLHLATASGPAGSALSIVNDQLVFTPGDGFDSLTAGQSATTTLSYTVHDDAGVTSSSSVTLTVTGVADGTPFTGGTTNDSHAGGNTDDKFDGGAGDDTLSGGGGADTLIGGVGNDSLAGGNGPDSLTGGTGNDIMTGGDGDDVLNGGTGRDLMTGGAGADKFVFSLTADSTVALTGQDEILDFNAAEGDKLNVVAIGAHTAGGLKFVTAFTHTLGQLIEVDQHNGTYLIEADVNGDGNADFAVLVHAGAPLLASDFILA